MSINSEKIVRKSDHHVVKLLPEYLILAMVDQKHYAESCNRILIDSKDLQ